jgi:hypothetical protein
VFAAIDGITVPETATVVADSVHVVLSVVLRVHVMTDALPFWTMSDVVKLLDPTAFEKTTVKFIGVAATGSD